jgi:RNA polymerase sigma-70 factor (ECF subfamily)
MDARPIATEIDPTLGLRMTTLTRDIDAAVDGDTAAFESLMAPRVQRTYRIALAILGSESDARDALQDAWVAAWRQLPALMDSRRFDAWVDQIVVNACRMVIRRRGRLREIPIPMDFDVGTTQPGPEQVAERDVLERAFDRLGVDQRGILVLHHLEGRSVAAIADLLAIPVGTAKSRLHAARVALERALEEER